MSQSLIESAPKPVRNHFTRCFDDPWVQPSGLTSPPDASWIRSSPTVLAASIASSMSLRGRSSKILTPSASAVLSAPWVHMPA